MFYRLIQTSRDTVDGAICVGTCAIYRRAALENSEGFAQIGHSEDVHTGVNLIRAGYKVRYLPVILAKGLCPETFSGYVNMMYRWCTGSLSLLADPRFHATPMRPSAACRRSSCSGSTPRTCTR
jgi:cellulose synthase (UDP-forming)